MVKPDKGGLENEVIFAFFSHEIKGIFYRALKLVEIPESRVSEVILNYACFQFHYC